MNLPTSLVFCNPEVDPVVVTQVLGFEPTLAESKPGLGTWKLTMPGNSNDAGLEEQLLRWLDILGPKAGELQRLASLGYAPYVDCPGLRADLSLWIEPAVLHRLGELRVALSIWLYEHPAISQS